MYILRVSIEDRNKIVQFTGKKKKYYYYSVLYSIISIENNWIPNTKELDYYSDVQKFCKLVKNAGGKIIEIQKYESE